jgi:hypothetical protein
VETDDLHKVLPYVIGLTDAVPEITPSLSDSESPILRPLLGHLAVSYVLDDGDSLRSIQQRELRGTRPEELHQHAIANLTRYADEQTVRLQPYGKVYAILFDGHFEASLMLVPGIWTELHRLLGPRLAVIAPARDVVAAGSADDSSALAELSGVLDRTSDGVDHPLPRDVYLEISGDWRLISSIDNDN